MPVFDWEKATVNYIQTFRSSHFLETVMHWFSDMNLAIIFGLIIFVFVGRKSDWKTRGKFLFLILLCVIIADLASHRLVKPFFERPRPFYLTTGCSSYKCWGLVSSHATNIAAVGAFLTFKKKKSLYFFLPLFILVSLSRLFLYKHFPLDVIGGGVLGVCIGLGVYYLSLKGQKLLGRG